MSHVCISTAVAFGTDIKCTPDSGKKEGLESRKMLAILLEIPRLFLTCLSFHMSLAWLGAAFRGNLVKVRKSKVSVLVSDHFVPH